MCFGGGSKKSDPAPPAPAPPPAEPTASVAQAEPETDGSKTRDASVRKGRRALRIDQTAPTTTGGSGLNIPV